MKGPGPPGWDGWTGPGAAAVGAGGGAGVLLLNFIFPSKNIVGGAEPHPGDLAAEV